MGFLSAGTKKRGRCREVGVSGGSTIPFVSFFSFSFFFISHGVFCFFVCLFLTRVASSCLYFVLFIIRGSFFIQQSEPL